MADSSRVSEERKLAQTSPEEFKRRLQMHGGNVLAKIGVAGETLLHLAALSGNLHLIPARDLTLSKLSVPNSAGETPMHTAAWKGNLKQLPQACVRGKAIRLRDRDGWAAVHCAACAGNLDQIPESEIVRNILLETKTNSPMSYESNTLHIAIHNGNLSQIPTTCLNDRNLKSRDSKGKHSTAYRRGQLPPQRFPAGYRERAERDVE